MNMTENITVHRAGDRSLLVDLPAQSVAGLTASLMTGRWAARLESVVPTSATVLVTVHRQKDLPELQSYLGEFHRDPSEVVATLAERRTTTVPVVYDGPDLEFVAEQCGLTRSEVIDEHTQAEHSVAFFGFAPGFAYIDGLSPKLYLPRRDTPRTKIPAGSVAIAANQSVVYPGNTPGGWHLIGRTTIRLWNLEETPPAKFNVGDRIVFEAVGGER
jgi:KipI family sensor histidine kinase inhibitor